LRRAIAGVAFVATVGMLSATAFADEAKPSLSQQLANPIADLTSVPIQYNTTRCLARAAIRRGPYRSSISSPSFRSS
jgi:hypothetical protein